MFPAEVPREFLGLRYVKVSNKIVISIGLLQSQIWNKYQSLLPKKQRSTVIYGHDSHRGLQLEKYSKGIDTGCVSGGQLTALVFTSGANPKPEVVSVKCRDYRPKLATSGDELGSS